MTRILVVIGTRPEAIKLFPVVHALRAQGGFDVTVCTSGQHRDLVRPILDFAGIACDVKLEVPPTHGDVNVMFPALFARLNDAIAAWRPDWVLVQGDTATALAAGVVAHGRRVPVAHVEAGLRSGSLTEPWPEEGYRRALAGLCEIHFAPTENSRKALLREGVAPERVFETGNTVVDALHWACARLEAEPSLGAVADAVVAEHGGKRIVLVTAHRRESLGEGFRAIGEALVKLSARHDIVTIALRHPNPDVSGRLDAVLQHAPAVRRIDPLDYPNFIRLLARADLVLTDSGGIQEEAPVLGTPAIVMRNSTERGEAVAEGTAVVIGVDQGRIVKEAERILDQPDIHAQMSRRHSPFGDGQASNRIADILRQQPR